MKHLFIALCLGLGALFAGPASAQDNACLAVLSDCPCNQLPACPDGNTPVGQTGFCTCPIPLECNPFTHFWKCTFFAATGWECGCEYVGPPDPPPPPPPPPFNGFCAGLQCPDGNPPISDGLYCLCMGG